MNLKAMVEHRVLSIQAKKWKHPLFYLLIPLSGLYRFFGLMHRWLYTTGVWKQKRVAARVLSIGNVIAGGGGKTSFIHLLCSACDNIAICARNFGKTPDQKVYSLQYGTSVQPEEVGDEPLLHLRHLPQAHVYVSRKKADAAGVAAKQHNTLIVDDGLQHHALKKDVEVVCINAKNPFDNGWVLPAGLLRENPKVLKKADYVVITHAEKYDPALELAIKKYTSAPQIGVEYVVEGDLPEKAVAFCGIGYPKGFFSMLEKNGVSLVAQHAFADHAFFEEEELRRLAQEGARHGATALLCTEKDFLKISPHLQSELSIRYVKVNLDIRFGKKNFDKLRSSIG